MRGRQADASSTSIDSSRSRKHAQLAAVRVGRADEELERAAGAQALEIDLAREHVAQRVEVERFSCDGEKWPAHCAISLLAGDRLIASPLPA
jgi:hypothetical protein